MLPAQRKNRAGSGAVKPNGHDPDGATIDLAAAAPDAEDGEFVRY
jgi:hypothetical protein